MNRGRVELRWLDELTPRMRPVGYLSALGLGLVTQLVAAAVCALIVGVLGYVLLAGYPSGQIPVGRSAVVGVLGALSVAAAMAAAAKVTRTCIVRAGLDERHAWAVGVLWAGVASLLWLVVSAAVGGSSLRQWLAGLAGIAIGVVLLLRTMLASPGR